MNLNLENLFEVKKQLYLEKMPFSKKKYNVLKEHKKVVQFFHLREHTQKNLILQRLSTQTTKKFNTEFKHVFKQFIDKFIKRTT